MVLGMVYRLVWAHPKSDANTFSGVAPKGKLVAPKDFYLDQNRFLSCYFHTYDTLAYLWYLVELDLSIPQVCWLPLRSDF